MSADPEAVMKQRRETAAALYAKIKNPRSGDAATVVALAEVISYANEGEYAESFKAALAAFKAKKKSKRDDNAVMDALRVLEKNNVIK